jgi:hypothetical protein
VGSDDLAGPADRVEPGDQAAQVMAGR